MRRSVMLVCAVMGFAGQAYPQCVPGPGQVAIFEHDSYGGTCRVRDAGSYVNPSAMGFPNDKMSSVKLGANAQAILCEHDNFGGTCETFAVSDANFGNNPIKHDRVSSMKVLIGPPPACNPAAYQVSLYDLANYAPGICTTIGLGQYPNPASMGLANDKVSSVKLGTNTEIVLCTDASYLGNCQLFTTWQADLAGTRIGSNEVTSLIVRTRGDSPCVPAANQASVYLHRDFEGPCVVKNAGDFATPEAMGIANDAISSARIGGSVQLVACVDAQYQRDCQLFTGDVNDFVPTRVGNDRVSSMKVQPRGFQDCVPQPNQASFFLHFDLLAPCVVKGIGDYPNEGAIGLPSDSISSLRVGSQVQVCACTGASYKETCLSFTADDPNLSDNSGVGDNSISSLKVQPRGAQCMAAPPQGFREVQVTNCHSDRRTVYIWKRDITPPSVGQWVQLGPAPSQWSGSSCPATGSAFVVPLAEGRTWEVRAVDPQALNCGGVNYPNGDCSKAGIGPLLGQTTGLIAQLQVN